MGCSSLSAHQQRPHRGKQPNYLMRILLHGITHIWDLSKLEPSEFIRPPHCLTGTPSRDAEAETACLQRPVVTGTGTILDWASNCSCASAIEQQRRSRPSWQPIEMTFLNHKSPDNRPTLQCAIRPNRPAEPAVDYRRPRAYVHPLPASLSRQPLPGTVSDLAP